MTTLPPAGDAVLQQDTDQLKMLSIFWYILAGIQALFGCIVLGWLGLVILAGLGMASSGRSDDAAAGATFSGFFGCFGLFALVIWWTMAFLNFTVARSLPRRKKRVLCLIMAAWACLVFPLGTLLGVFTLVVMSRPSVKAGWV